MEHDLKADLRELQMAANIADTFHGRNCCAALDRVEAFIQSHIEAQPVDQKEAMDALSIVLDWANHGVNLSDKRTLPDIYSIGKTIRAALQAKQPAPVDVDRLFREMKLKYAQCDEHDYPINKQEIRIANVVLAVVNDVLMETGIIVPKGDGK